MKKSYTLGLLCTSALIYMQAAGTEQKVDAAAQEDAQRKQAATEKFIKAIQREDSKAAQQAIAEGADPNGLRTPGLSPLHGVARGKSPQMLQQFLSTYDVDVNMYKQHTPSPLAYLVSKGGYNWSESEVQKLALLLAHGADPLIKDSTGKNVFDLVVEQGDYIPNHIYQKIILLRDGRQNYLNTVLEALGKSGKLSAPVSRIALEYAGYNTAPLPEWVLEPKNTVDSAALENRAIEKATGKSFSWLRLGDVETVDRQQVAQELSNELIRAADTGNIALARELVQRGADINGALPGHDTALIQAIKADKLLFALWLLSFDAIDINKRGRDSTTALIEAVAMDNLPITNLLIQFKRSKVDPSVVDAAGKKAVDYIKKGARIDSDPRVLFLRAQMSGVQNQDVGGAMCESVTPIRTPQFQQVHYSCPYTCPKEIDPSKKQQASQQQLAPQFVEPQPTFARPSAAQRAAQEREALLSGADEKRKKSDAADAPMIRAQQTQPTLTADEQKKLNNDLVEAAKDGNVDAVKKLLAQRAQKDGKRTGGFQVTPLIAAAESGALAAVQYLISQRADLDATDSRGDTALIRAAMPNTVGNVIEPAIKAAIVRALLNAGADATVTNADGKTAAFYGKDTPAVKNEFDNEALGLV